MRKFLRNAGAIAAIALAILLVIELAARAFVDPPPQSIYDRPEPFDVPPKDPSVFRIVAIGASTVAGWPMPELGFTAQLESALNRLQADPPVEIVNLGYLGKSSEYARQMVEDCGRYDPDCIVVLSGHNEYLNRTDEDQSIRGKFRRATLRLASVRFLLSHTTEWFPPVVTSNYHMPERLVPCDRSNPWFTERIDRHRRNLTAAAAWARDHEIPLIVCTPPSGLAEWPPVYQLVAQVKLNPRYDADVKSVTDMLANGEIEAAERAINKSLSEYGDDAMMFYLKGQVCRRTGRLEAAYDFFVRARDLDPFPQRVLSVMTENIREVARDEGAILADIAAAFENESEGRLVGMDLIGDNVHPTTLGYALVTREIVRVLAAQEIFFRSGTQVRVNDSAQEWKQAFLAEFPSDGQKRWFQFKIADAYSKYCQKYPFFHFDLALDYKRKAIELAESVDIANWALYGELGTLLILTGDTDAGIEELKRASRMKGTPLDPSKKGQINWLPEALAKANVTVESLSYVKE